jgi:hypothetical protein
MAVTRLTTNGLTGTKYDIASADNYYMEPIATTLLGSDTASVTFSNIPNTYKNLQIRVFGRSNRSDPNGAVGIQFNSDTGNNYGTHGLWGDGSGIGAAQLNYPASAITLPWIAADTNSANVFGVSIIDILDYLNANKNTTVRGLTGFDNNGNGQAGFGSGLWSNTAPINSITVKPFYGSLWKQHSRFSLYGIKG